MSLIVQHTLSWLIFTQEITLKKIMGKTDRVVDALERLDVLTKEENLMTAARTLEVAQHADDKITIIKEVISDVAGDVEETKVLTHHVADNVTAIRSDVDVIKGDTRSVSDNTKVTRHGAPLFQLLRTRAYLFLPYNDLAIDEMQRSSLPTLSSSIFVAETCSQGTSREISFEHGSPLQTLPSTIIPHVALSTTEQQSGLLEVVYLMNGRRTAHCCGSVAIVCFPSLDRPSRLLMTLLFSWVGQKYSLVRLFTIIQI